jgi:subtilisin family serine protease
MRRYDVLFLVLIAALSTPAGADNHVPSLALPEEAGNLADLFNKRNTDAATIIESYSSSDYLTIGRFNSVVVETNVPLASSFSSGQNLAGAAAMGVTATQIGPTTFELQISSQPILASEFGVDESVLIERRAKALGDILDQDSSIVDWYPNYRVETQQITDPFYQLQWHYFPNGELEHGVKYPGGTDLTPLIEFAPGTEEVVVAVLDTGFLFDHMDAANVVDGYDFVSDIVAANDGDGWDPDAQDPGDACDAPGLVGTNSWHGSHVAGTIGALAHNGLGAVGINKSISIMPVRVLGKCGGNFEDILTAVLWSADLLDSKSLLEFGLPRVSRKADIINMSLGGPGRCTPRAARVFDRVLDSGTLVVVAAGNDATDARDFVPASCPGVMAVAASDMSGSLVSRYSNYGDLVTIMAPGGDITADLDANGLPDGVFSMVGGDDFAFFNGTSMAAPHVAGLAAHLYALDANMSPVQAANLMINFGLDRTKEQCPEHCGRLLNAAFLIPE